MKRHSRKNSGLLRLGREAGVANALLSSCTALTAVTVWHCVLPQCAALPEYSVLLHVAFHPWEEVEVLLPF